MRKIVVRDSEIIKHILIEVNMQKKTVAVLSAFSAWENLAFILEGLGVTAEKCIQEGMKREDVYDEIKKYIMDVLSSKTIVS